MAVDDGQRPPDQIVDLIPQDQEYADVIDARSEDQRSAESSFERQYQDAMNGIETASNLSQDDLLPLLQRYEQRINEQPD